jgi:hypothetical protein
MSCVNRALLARLIDLYPYALTGNATHLGDLRPEHHLNAFVAEKFKEGFPGILILAAEQLRPSLDHGDLAAEAPHRLSELQSHVPAAQDEKMARTAI